MNRSTFNKFIVPGLFSAAEESYREQNSKALWKKLCKVDSTSKRAYEENAYWGGMGLPVIKPEGTEITYDDIVPGPTKRWNHITYGLGMRITEEAIEDIIYSEIPTDMKSQSGELTASFNELWEILVHDIINNGPNTTTHTAGDGLAIFATNHPTLRGGTWSNLLSPAADLSATSLQTSIDNFTLTKNDSNRYQIIKPKYLLVHPNNAWKANELLDSKFDPETANNSVNSILGWGLQVMVSPYLTDTDAFTLIAEPSHENGGVIAFMRRDVTVKQDSDFETGDLKIKATARFSVEVNKPSNMFQSQGA